MTIELSALGDATIIYRRAYARAGAVSRRDRQRQLHGDPALQPKHGTYKMAKSLSLLAMSCIAAT